MKRLLCILTALCLLLSACGCKSTQESTSSLPELSDAEKTASDSVNLLFCYSDSFNPYIAETEINRNASRLIFDPLLKLDNSYEPVYCLAESVTLEGTVCTVRLKNAYFTDGSAVSAQDVVYSYNLARASSTVYASRLYEVSSVTAADGLTVVFNLTRSDPYFDRLIDFPIIKTDSDKRTDVDGVSLPPIGCGRYTPSEDTTRLLRNDGYYGQKPAISEIKLINSPDAESVSHYVEVGATDFYYTDISDGNIVRMSGKKTDINLNHLVYIGINHSYGQLSERNLRYAVSSAIGRDEICSTAFYNNAKSATGFFPTYFKDTSPVQTLENQTNLQITVENLEKIGYNSLNDSGYRVNSSGNYINLTLLVNGDNTSHLSAAELISEQLSRTGIKITVIKKSYADYTASLQAGDFQLYLAEIRILANMDMSQLVLTGGSAAYGITEPTPLEDGTVPANTVANTVSAFYSGSASVSDLAGVLLTEMPVIPICYRNGLLFSDDTLSSTEGEDIAASRSDIFLSIEHLVCTR